MKRRNGRNADVLLAFFATITVARAPYGDDRATPCAPRLRAPKRGGVPPRLVLDERRYALPLLLGRNVDDNYYDLVTDYKAMDWAYTEAFVAFLMQDTKPGGHADKLLSYAFIALCGKRGDSSSTFDKVFGQRIEELEKPFTAWLREHAKATPGR